MTTLFLVRHAAHEGLGRILTGRLGGVRLGETGLAQAEALGRRFAGDTIGAVWSSPMERAVETAAPIARRLGAQMRIVPGLNEIDFGSWTGRSFEALGCDPLWGRWNTVRSVTRPPGGETMLEAQARIVQEIERARREHPGGAVIMVSHADLIRAAIAFHLGLSLDHLLRFEVGAGSVSTLQVGEWGARLDRLNECPS